MDPSYSGEGENPMAAAPLSPMEKVCLACYGDYSDEILKETYHYRLSTHQTQIRHIAV